MKNIYMYLCEILFETKCVISHDVFYNLLNSWRNNGQVIDVGMNLFEKENESTGNKQYLIYASVPNVDSLDNCYDNEYVKEHLKSLEKLGVRLLISIKGYNNNIDYFEHIQGTKSLVLYYDETLASPVRDYESFISIPLYLLPHTGYDNNYKNIIDWYRLSESLYAMETWSNGAKRQLLDINSRYNKLGREICKLLEEELSFPVYYYLYHYTYNASVKSELNRSLGVSGDTIVDISNEHFQLINHSERIVSQITPQILDDLRR